MKKCFMILGLLITISPAVFLNSQVKSAVKTKLFSISTGEKPVYYPKNSILELS